jgi:hypothetical protein
LPRSANEAEVRHGEPKISPHGRYQYRGRYLRRERFGLAITDIPRRLDKSADIYSVILDGPGTHFKLLVRPIWETDDGVNKTIGAQIENSPWNWTEFVMRQEAQIEDFSWQSNH